MITPFCLVLWPGVPGEKLRGETATEDCGFRGWGGREGAWRVLSPEEGLEEAHGTGKMQPSAGDAQ